MARKNKEQKGHKVQDYRLDLVNHQTHETLWSMIFSKNSAIVSVSAGVAILLVLIYVLFAFTPLKRTIPGYPNERTKKIAVENAIKVDSLEKIITRWELYSENIRRAISGTTPLNIDSLIRTGGNSQTVMQEELAKQDSILRSQVVAQKQFELGNSAPRDLQIEGVHFFTPLKGVISQDYDNILHPFIDITAPKNSVVTAILDGTVIFAGWIDEVGYTIGIQHSNDIISIYKHNEKLLKTTGDKVTAGTPISLVGGTGTLSTGDHLHFELWYKGEPVDPKRFINF